MGDERAKKIEAALFLEGRSIPFTSVNCDFRVGAPATATINAVPLREINNILPRTLCHIFVRDNSYHGTFKPWVLLFEGEIYGIGGGKSTSSRSIDLYAMDFSNYWDNAKQSYINLRATTGNVNVLANVADSKTNEKNQVEEISSATSTKAFLTNLILKELDDGKDFLTAVKVAIEGVKESNSFFRYGDARIRIDERIAFASSGKIKELFDFEKNDSLLDQVLGAGNGGLVTVRTIINKLMGMIFHEMVSVPAPSKIDSTIVRDRYKSVSGLDINDDNKGIGEKNAQSIGSFIMKPDSFMLPPPKCNVLFPDFYESINFSRNFFNEVTRTEFTPFNPTIKVNNGNGIASMQKVFSPSGVKEFTTSKKADTSESTLAENKSFDGPSGQGNIGDDSKDITASATTLQSFNYQSYEEILKGIFSDMGTVMPSAQALQKTKSGVAQGEYTQKISDFLFHKKRLAARHASASGPLNIAPVVGFPMLVLDSSDAEQHIIGTLQHISHTINAGGGGLTTYSLGFARYTEEIDFWSGEAYEPPIEPWYDEDTFGKNRPIANPKDPAYEHLYKSQKFRIAEMGHGNDFGKSKIEDFYKSLLGNSDNKGHLGALPITSEKYPMVASAAIGLMNEYRAANRAGSASRFVSLHTRRDYVTLKENFTFLGATFKNKKTDPTFWKKADLIFKGDVFDGNFVKLAKNPNSRDEALEGLFGKEATEKRRAPINRYRTRLQKERGFNG